LVGDATSIFAMAMMAKAQGGNETQSAAQQQNTTAINNYITASQNVKSIERSIATEKTKLEGLNAKLEKANNADTKIASLKDELTKLDKDNGVESGKENANLKAYDAAKKKFDLLTDTKTTVEGLDTQIGNAQSKFDTASKASFTTRGEKAITIKLDASGKATPAINQNNYMTIVEKNNGKETKKLDETSFRADEKKASDMEEAYSTAKSELDQLKETRGKELKKVELPENASITQIDTAINNAKIAMNEAGGTKMGDGENATTVNAYNASKTKIEAEIKEYEACKADKANIEKEIKTQTDKIKNLEEVKLPEAQDKLEVAKAACSGMVGSATTLTNAEGAYAKEQGEYDASKSQLGANGKKRNAWQKFWGSNKSATQIAEQREAKDAKRDLKAAQKQFKNSGMTPEMLAQLRAAGLVT
ncbi:MAG: hypothetical protein NC200_07905, partial [Candidatus Gastranaerophilales bacterium]|nr:hypothetical protein [Candidatus Gastranaerophilales bacterium]